MYTLKKKIYIRLAPILDTILKTIGKNIYAKLYDRKLYYDTKTDVGNKILFVGNFERAELSIINKLITKDSTIFDIGANIGTHSVPMALKASNGVVFSFEPAKKTYQFLLKNIYNLKNIYPVLLAVSEKSGKATFHNASDNAYSGLNITGKKPIVDTENVLTISTDDFVHLQNINKLDFIKIDVEGHEQSVINGAMKTLANLRPKILIEICEDEKNGVKPQTLIQQIIDAGYKPYTISGWKIIPYEKVNTKDYNYLFIPTEQNFDPNI